MHRKLLGPAGILSLQTHSDSPHETALLVIGLLQVTDIMSLIRFEHIWTFLHPADSEKQILPGQPGHDKITQGPSLSGLATRENAVCLLTKSRSIN